MKGLFDYRRLLPILLVVLLFSLFSIGRVVADTYENSIGITVYNNSASTYGPIGILAPINNTQLYEYGYINSSGLDTNLQEAGVDRSYSVATNITAIYAPSYGVGEQRDFTYYLEDSPGHSSLPIVPGYGGYVWTTNSASLHPGSDFSVSLTDTYVNTAAGSGNLGFKAGALQVAINATTSGTIDGRILTATLGATATINPNAAGSYANFTGTSFAGMADVSDATYCHRDSDGAVYTAFGLETPAFLGSNQRITAVNVFIREMSSDGVGTSYGGVRLGSDETVASVASGGAWANVDMGALARPGGGDWVASDFTDLQVVAGANPGAVGWTGSAKTWVIITYDYDNAITTVSASGIASGEHDVTVGLRPCLDYVDTNSDYTGFGDNDAFSFTNGAGVDEPFTIIQRFLLDDATAGAFFAKETAGNREYSAVTSVGDAISFSLVNPDASAYIERDTGAITAYEGSWVHFAFTYDGSETALGLHIYANAVNIDAGAPGGGVYTGMTNGTAPFEIGRATMYAQFIDGRGASMKVYNRELSAAEILADYNGANSTIDLVSYWRMDETAGLPQDSSGNGHNATVNTADWITNGFAMSVDNAWTVPKTMVAVPDNANNWIWGSNATPYMGAISVLIGGVEKLLYQSATIVQATNIVDRTGSGNTGTLVWGSNPAGFVVSVGGITPLTPYVSPSGTDVVAPNLFEVPTGTIPNSDPAEAAVAGLPQYAAFARAATSLGWSTPHTYGVAIFITAIVLAVGVLAAFGSALAAGLFFNLTIAMGSGVGYSLGASIIDWYIPLFTLLITIFLVYLLRWT